MSIDAQLDKLSDRLVELFFEKVAQRLERQPVDVPLPPSAGSPARPAATRARREKPPKQLPAPSPDVVAAMKLHDPDNRGIPSQQLSSLLGVDKNRARYLTKRAKEAGTIRCEGRTNRAIWFRI